MWAHAVHLKLPGAEPNPLDGFSWADRTNDIDSALTSEEAVSLARTAKSSHNRQLKYIVTLLILTRARVGELLKAKWDDIDLSSGTWKLPVNRSGQTREIVLPGAAIRLLSELKKGNESPHVIVNAATQRPYQSVVSSWDVVRTRTGLPCIELDDLRYCSISTKSQQDALADEVLGQVDMAEREGTEGSLDSITVPAPSANEVLEKAA
jgi:integrase